MTRYAIWTLAVAILAAALASPAHARKAPRHDSQAAVGCVYGNTAVIVCHGQEKLATGRPRVTDANGNRADPRPHAWCGWWLRQQLGVADRAFNLARKWASYGTRAPGPASGVVVVWPHHVGLITGRADGQWIVKSGNDGHAVRERPRSLRGVIAFRNPPQRYAGL